MSARSEFAPIGPEAGKGKKGNEKGKNEAAQKGTDNPKVDLQAALRPRKDTPGRATSPLHSGGIHGDFDALASLIGSDLITVPLPPRLLEP